jgi:hypothetical protein
MLAARLRGQSPSVSPPFLVFQFLYFSLQSFDFLPTL